MGMHQGGSDDMYLRRQAEGWLRRKRGWSQAADVDDACQETELRFLKWGRQNQIDDRKGSERSIKLGILFNVLRERERARSRRKEEPIGDQVDQVIDADAPSPIDGLVHEDARRLGLIETWWREELTERRRVAVLRVYGIGTLGEPSGADRSAAWRAIRQLQEIARRHGLRSE